jgi:hypothetical protein
MEDEDIERELFELARDWMWASKLKKTPGHKSLATDFAMWILQCVFSVEFVLGMICMRH